LPISFSTARQPSGWYCRQHRPGQHSPVTAPGQPRAQTPFTTAPGLPCSPPMPRYQVQRSSLLRCASCSISHPSPCRSRNSHHRRNPGAAHGAGAVRSSQALIAGVVDQGRSSRRSSLTPRLPPLLCVRPCAREAVRAQPRLSVLLRSVAAHSTRRRYISLPSTVDHRRAAPGLQSATAVAVAPPRCYGQCAARREHARCSLAS
jgi:hypothetical protein